jgi:hypothetical protein
MNAYGLIVRLYPDGHPRDEMLGVIEEVGRPWFREVPALVVGGLRARSGSGQTAGLRWIYAARAAALMLLVAGALAPVLDLRYGVQLHTDLTVATWVCAGLAAAAIVGGVRLWAFGLAVAALALSSIDGISTAAVGEYTLAAVLLLVPGRPLPVRNPLPILLALAWSADYTAPAWVQPALLAALLLWTVIDERILLAAGLALLAGLTTAVVEAGEIDDARGLIILAALRVGLPVAVLCAAAAITRHRTRA